MPLDRPMTKFILILIIGLIPAMLWGLYFWHKNPSRQSFKEIVGIFLLGTLSVLPVYWFHQWVLRELMRELKNDWSFLSNTFWSATVELLLLLIFIVLFVSLFAILSAIGARFRHRSSDLEAREDFSIYKKLYNLSPILVFFVLFLLIEVGSLGFGTNFISTLTGSIIVFAVLEEYFKYAINPFLVRKKLHSVGTAMVNALYVGLAFAFVENILFFNLHYGSDGFWSLVLYRSVFTSLLHVCVSGILGYFYGLSLFSNAIVASHEIEKGKYNLPFWLRRVTKKETIFKSVSVNQGFFIAALVHAGFNLFLNVGLKSLASITVLILAFFVLRTLHSRFNQIQYGLVGTQTMPKIDFEHLKLQIAVLKEQKAIQQQRYGA